MLEDTAADLEGGKNSSRDIIAADFHDNRAWP